MTPLDEMEWTADKRPAEPHAAMEKRLIEEYLQEKGFRWSDLRNQPDESARILMAEACRYASLQLAQIEAAAHFREKIRSHPEPHRA